MPRQQLSPSQRPLLNISLSVLGGLVLIASVYFMPASQKPTEAQMSDSALTKTPPSSVEWASFEAMWDGEVPVLHWQTARETNSDYFQIERMIGAESIFDTIGIVTASGESHSMLSYVFPDQSLPVVAAGGIIHYRLRQIDRNGRFEHSATLELRSKWKIPRVTVSPNPAHEFIHVNLDGLAHIEGQIWIVSPSGEEFFSGQLSTDDQSHVTIDAYDWPKGAYTLQLQVGDLMTSQGLVLE